MLAVLFAAGLILLRARSSYPSDVATARASDDVAKPPTVRSPASTGRERRAEATLGVAET